MNNKIEGKKESWWQEGLKYILIAATIAFVSFLFPGESYFNYKYQKGGTWNYEDLTAPFNYALNRSDDEIDLERSKISDDFVPIYVKDDKSVDRFNISVDNLDLSHLNSPATVKDFLKSNALVHYRKGILSTYS